MNNSENDIERGENFISAVFGQLLVILLTN